MRLFISYAKKDTRQLALALADALAARSIDVWLDRSLRAGHSWELQIQAEIDNCDVMIVLYSPDINRHKQGQSESYVLTEIAYAKYTADKLIIPVMAQQTDPPISLTMEQYIDYTLDGLTLDDLVNALCEELDSAQVDSSKAAFQPLGQPMTCDVVLKDVGPYMIAVIDIIRTVTGLGIGESKNLVDSVPSVVLRAVAQDAAEDLKMQLETKGARVDVRCKERDSAPSSPISRSTELPKPFGWIDIPIKNITIAKYPVTNAQYALFVAAGGYTNERWWTVAGWEARKAGWYYDAGWKPSGKPWAMPRFWQDAQWNSREHPVVGVSWYEAVAYCQWLSDATGEAITLPTESQWRYVAEGDKKLRYPWGNKWHGDRCNHAVSPYESKCTTPVTQFEGKGDSPFGVVDMAGNVWEWTVSGYDARTDTLEGDAKVRVLCGGSWYDFGEDKFQSDSRDKYVPYVRLNNRGFRLARV